MKKRTLEQREEYFQEILDEVKQESRILESTAHIQHGSTSVYEHCVEVARQSLEFAHRHNIEVNEKELIRGALLHDYFLYDWHNQLTPHHLHGFFHPGKALKNAQRDMELTEVEADIIKKHMFPMTVVPPRYKESWIVCMVDKQISMRETIHRNMNRKG